MQFNIRELIVKIRKEIEEERFQEIREKAEDAEFIEN
jgi:hypothetical protein